MVAKVDRMGLVVRMLLPVLGREVAKDQQFLSVFLQAERRLGALRLIGLEEQIACLLGVCLCLGPPDRVQGLFRFRLGRLG